MDELDFSRDGIIHMPIYDYLLTPNAIVASDSAAV